jgi:hypothetical protein
MSKRPAKKPAATTTSAKLAKEEIAPAPPVPQPLKPRPKLFWILLMIFLIWLGGLLALYFTKVYPMRYPSSAPVAGAKS